MSLILTEVDQIKLREFLKAKLSIGMHEVVFQKADGTIRVMRGTRDGALIDSALYEKWSNPPPKKDGSKRVESTTSVPMFDSEINQFRSFSTEKLVSVDGININELLKQANIIIQ